MAARDDLKIWASVVNIDPIYNTPNTLEIPDDLWFNGWLRTNPVGGQHINKVLQLITKVLKENTLDPTLNLSEIDDAATARTNLGIDISLYNEKSQNLNDVVNKATARTNLGLSDLDLLNKFYPVGTVYENKTNSANPSTYLGGGTWAAEGQGRVSIGAGSGTDINTVVQAYPAGTTGGEYTHSLTDAENGPHTHPYVDRYYIDQAASLSAATNKETAPVGYNSKLGGSGDTDNTTFLTFNATTSSTGSGTAHNNVQPYAVYYRWVRTL